MTAGRWRTSAVVAGVLALAALAAADALRGDGQEAVPSGVGTTSERAPTLAQTLRRQGVSGSLLYSDAECQLHLLQLPELGDEAPLEWPDRCRFSVGAGRILGDDEVASPDGQLVARCRSGHVQVLIGTGKRVLSREPGCAPAWRPDGALTYFHAGRVLLDGRVLLSRADLRRAANRHHNVRGVGQGYPVDTRVTSLAWFDDERLAAALRISILGVEPQYLLAVFEGRRTVASVTSFTGPFGTLISGPGGAYVADERGLVLARNGIAGQLGAGVPGGRVVAFSPDERWIVSVTEASVYLLATPVNEASIRSLRLPLGARDAAWLTGLEGVPATNR